MSIRFQSGRLGTATPVGSPQGCSALGKWSGLSGAWICWERFQACANPPDPRGIRRIQLHPRALRATLLMYLHYTHIVCALDACFPHLHYLPTFVVPMRNCPAAAVVTRRFCWFQGLVHHPCPLPCPMTSVTGRLTSLRSFRPVQIVHDHWAALATS